MKNGMVLSKGLTEEQREEIFALDRICAEKDHLTMKLNRDTLKMRSPEEVNDFLYYENGKLVAFLGLYDIRGGSVEIEVTGMVAPESRKKGIMTTLYKAGLEECRKRNAKSLLLISERKAEAGQRFLKGAGGKYEFSEYRMIADMGSIKEEKEQRADMFISPMKMEEIHELLKIDEICFGREAGEIPESYYTERGKRTYVARIVTPDGTETITGKLSLSGEGTSGYISGVAVKPEFRGKGYARSLLKYGMEEMKGRGIQTAMLEVEANNDNALGLYKSVGFREVTIYDYYRLID